MLWIVGKIFKDFQEYLVSHEIAYGVIADFRKPVSVSPQVPSITLDLSSQEAAIASLKDLPSLPEVTAIMTAGYEQYVLPAAWLSEFFKVPGPSLSSASAATDKTLMRQAFQSKYPEITPAYLHVTSWGDVVSFMESHDFPVMLKPSNLMKSLYVTRNDDLEELQQNYENMTRELPKLQSSLGLVEAPAILIEEYMEGSMHTVAAFVDARGNLSCVPGIADCVTAQNIGVNDNYLFSRTLPSRLHQNEQEAILVAAQKGVAALGLTSTPLHIEVILTPHGPKIIEIGARIGGYRARMYAYASGIDMYKASVDTAFDEPVELSSSVAKSCAFLELFPTETGTFSDVEGADQLQQLPSLISAAVKRKPHEQIGPAKEGYRAVMVIMLGHPDTAIVLKDIAFIRTHLRVVVQQ